MRIAIILIATLLAHSNLLTAEWTRLGDMPFPHGENANAVIDGKLYIFGSFWGTTPDSRINRFDPLSRTWAKVSNLPSPDSANNHFTAGSSVWNGEVYLCGGKAKASSSGHNRVHIYNPRANTWRRGPDLPEIHWAGPAVVVGNQLHVLTGAQENTVTTDHHFVLDLTNPAAGWSSLAKVPQPRVHAAGVALGGHVYVVGGEHHHYHDGDTSTVQRYDPATNTWQTMASMPLKRSHHEWATFVHDGKILSVGGMDSTGTKGQAEILEYDPMTNAWRIRLRLPFPLTSSQSKIIDGALYVCGGGKGDWWTGTGKEVWTYPIGTTPPPATVPATPSGLLATAASSSRIDLRWTDAANNETGFVIERRTGLGSYAQTATVGANVTTYASTGLTAATTYTYRVRAVNAAGYSGASNESSAATQAVPTTTRDAFARIEAESYNTQSGLGIYSGGSGQKIGSIENNTWARYALDFAAGARACQFRAASATSGGTIELRLGSTTGTLIGSCTVPGTGGWNNFVDLSCPVNGVSGVQQLHLVFKGGSGALLDVDWFQFTTAVPTAPDAFTRVEAESFAGQNGLGIYSGGSGQKIGSIENNTWARFTLDFAAGASACQFRAASKTSGGTIELRLGSTTGTLIGSCIVPGTGGWDNFVDLTCPVNGVSGVQQLYLVFKGGGGVLLDIDWFEFTPGVPSGNG